MMLRSVAVDDDDDRGPSIQIAGSRTFCAGVYDVGYVGQADRRAAIVATTSGCTPPRAKAGHW
jgi:hypothetical protein